MNRSQMIERMLVLCDTRDEKEKFERELIFKSSENVRAIYESAKPRLEARREQLNRVIRRQKRRQQRYERLQRHEEACSAWSRRWRPPVIAYPLKPSLEFCLTDLHHMAMFLLRCLRDQGPVIRARTGARGLVKAA